MIRGAALLLRFPSSPLPTPLLSSSSFLSFPNAKLPRCPLAPVEAVDASASGGDGEGGGNMLLARERRQLRNERRESKAASGRGWREVVEQLLLEKPKKQRTRETLAEKFNLDNLARLGSRWWIVRVSRVASHDVADRLARSLANNFPGLEFKVYYPAVRRQTKLKNGSESVKLKPVYPGSVFLNCVLNKEIHDFIREVPGIWGFLGFKVGTVNRKIIKPKPVAAEQMEVAFRRVKEEQERESRHQEEQTDSTMQDKPSKPKKGSKKNSKSASYKSLAPGANVRILSGPLSEFTGSIIELNRRSGKVTVRLQLFGKESLADLEVDQIALEAS